MAMNYGYGIIPWSPLAGGLLTGKYKRGKDAPGGSRFENASGRQAERFTDQVYDVTEALEAVIGPKGVPMSQFALAWVLRQPGVTSPIIGPRTMEQLEDNLKAAEVEITDSDREAVDGVVKPGRMVSAFYEADFGPRTYR
jgi:aryl-alcohol dehydrogenase-like predicted oxidoreductase